METKVTPITFDNPVYLAQYNCFENSYLCEKPGYVVFEFHDSVSDKSATLCITDSDPRKEESYPLPFPLIHEVDKNSCIYVCAGSRIYVNLGLTQYPVIAKFIPITHNFDRNKSIVKQVIDQDNNSTKTGINEAAGKLLK